MRPGGIVRMERLICLIGSILDSIDAALESSDLGITCAVAGVPAGFAQIIGHPYCQWQLILNHSFCGIYGRRVAFWAALLHEFWLLTYPFSASTLLDATVRPRGALARRSRSWF